MERSVRVHHTSSTYFWFEKLEQRLIIESKIRQSRNFQNNLSFQIIINSGSFISEDVQITINKTRHRIAKVSVKYVKSFQRSLARKNWGELSESRGL
jgi:hypothetical protein